LAKAYIIARIDVTDPEEYAKYTARTETIAARFGGRFIVRAGRCEALEGHARSRNVVIEFPDHGSARAFYDCDDYRAVLPHALAGSTRELILVEGVEEFETMPAYWIAHVTVTDAEAYGRYASLASEAIAKHGGRFLARGGRHLQMEGRDHVRNVVVEFPSLEAAESCYRSAEYQAALDHARGASERDLVLVEGM
jgi:uncharacterized protein (DUF1330 family)